MNKQSIYVLCTAFIVIGWVCGNQDEGPVSPRIEALPLISSSFESNGRFTMDGWSLTESMLSGLVDSSGDTPYTGNRYSLKLRRDTITADVPGVTKTVISAKADTSMQYSLSLFAKGKGTMLVRQRTEDGPKSETFYISNAEWNSISFFLFKARPEKDTITITFRPLSIDPIPFLIIDDVRMTYWRKN